MRRNQAKTLLARCADLAADAPKVKDYLLLYSTGEGEVRILRGGNSCTSQLGILEVARRQILRGYESEEEPE